MPAIALRMYYITGLRTHLNSERIEIVEDRRIVCAHVKLLILMQVQVNTAQTINHFTLNSMGII